MKNTKNCQKIYIYIYFINFFKNKLLTIDLGVKMELELRFKGGQNSSKIESHKRNFFFFFFKNKRTNYYY